MKTALVVGGSGLVGSNLTRTLAEAGGWNIVSTQRRLPAVQPADRRVIALDLPDLAAARAALGALEGVTHIYFLARTWRPGYLIEREDNVAALAAVLDAVQEWPALEHVQLIHGLKWYGSTLGPFKTPARESDPKPAVEHFYYDQRALVAQRQEGRAWGWSTLRPHCVSGVATGSPSNVMLGIGVYAALMKAQGLPLAFPASQEAFDAQLNHTDARLLSRAMIWAATSPRARNEDFNIANGDIFSWRQVWPALARYFGMAVADPRPRVLHEEMPAMSGAWRELAARTNLKVTELAPLVDWHFMDATLALRWDQTMSLDKLRAHGFAEQVDTPAMMLHILDTYRRQGILPSP